MEMQFLFLHLSQWKNSNLSAWFHIYCSTHVVVVDDREVASMEVESLGSLSSYILICLDLLRWSNGRTCVRSWQSWVFVWDLILAKTPDLVSNVEVLTDHFNSDHFPVSFNIKLSSGRPRKSVPRKKKINKANFTELNELLKYIPWNCAFLEEDVDFCFERVNDLVPAAADMCIPTFTVKKEINPPWITRDILNKINKKNR